MSLSRSDPRSLPAEQNESTAFSESLRGGRAHLLAISKTGSRGSLQFGSLLGRELERRSLYYTPHYTLALMGHHRRILVNAGRD